MKKIGIIALCACLCLSLCACSSDLTHRGDKDNGVSNGVVSDNHASNGLIEDRTDREVTPDGDMARNDGGEFLSGNGMDDKDMTDSDSDRLLGGGKDNADNGMNGTDNAANASGATGNAA